MIAVIADDFTGAAEIGGIGLRFGQKVVIETNVDKSCPCDLLIVVADTRSLLPKEAAREIEKISRKLKKLKPKFIFKKLDSVLRGNIASELVAQMDIVEKPRAIVIAGNPQFKRTINDGTYFVADLPLGETFFANDPEFPQCNSNVLDIVKSEEINVFSMKHDDHLPKDGIIIGDVTCWDDLEKWTAKIDPLTVVAGGAGFFIYVLKKYFNQIKVPTDKKFNVGKSALFVFGSLYPKSESVLKQMKGSNFKVINMPLELYQSSDDHSESLNKWISEILLNLRTGHKVIIMVNHELHNEKGLPERIKDNVGQVVADVLKQEQIDDLWIEGGGTTSSILQYLKISKLFPFKELDLGVIQMRVHGYPNLKITTKPGSYKWPEDMWITETTKEKYLN